MLLLQIAEAVAEDSIPWPAQLGLNGVSLGALIAFFIWLLRQISLGRWYPSSIVDKMLAEKDATIAGKEIEINGRDLLIGEQTKTIRAQEATAAMSARALEQATSNQGWIDVLVRRTIGTTDDDPQTGHNSAEEVAR